MQENVVYSQLSTKILEKYIKTQQTYFNKHNERVYSPVRNQRRSTTSEVCSQFNKYQILSMKWEGSLRLVVC